MRVRGIELRILGVVVAGLWFVAFGLVLMGYRPGGPVDILVGISAVGPLLVAIAAVRWPPVAHGDRAFAAIAWLALGAMLLLVPSLAGLVSQLTGRGPQTLLPSFEAAYPWLLALVATGLFAGLGVARRRLGETTGRPRRLAAGVVVGLALVLMAGSAFASTAIVNELALSGRPAISSRFGPVDPALEPPPCDGILVSGATARLDLRMDSSIDSRYTGRVVVGGVRNGADVFWSGFAGTRLALGNLGLGRIAGRTWELSPGRPWTLIDTRRGDGRDLDRQLVLVALAPGNRRVAEDHGLATIEGARARHCRIPVDGAIMREALPEIDLFVGQTDISRWRGQVDYWVFGDGQLGQADGEISGPATGLDDDALLADIRFRLLAYDRGSQITVPTPGR